MNKLECENFANNDSNKQIFRFARNEIQHETTEEDMASLITNQVWGRKPTPNFHENLLETQRGVTQRKISLKFSGLHMGACSWGEGKSPSVELLPFKKSISTSVALDAKVLHILYDEAG